MTTGLRTYRLPNGLVIVLNRICMVGNIVPVESVNQSEQKQFTIHFDGDVRTSVSSLNEEKLGWLRNDIITRIGTPVN